MGTMPRPPGGDTGPRQPLDEWVTTLPRGRRIAYARAVGARARATGGHLDAIMADIRADMEAMDGDPEGNPTITPIKSNKNRTISNKIKRKSRPKRGK